MTFAVSLPPSALLQEGATDGQALVWDDNLGIFRPQNVNEVEELTVSGLTSGRVVGTSTGGLLVDNAAAGLELRAPSLTIRNPNVSNASSVIFQNVNGTQLAQVGSASDGTGLLSTYYTLNITGYSSGSGDAVTIWGGSVPTRIVRFNTTGTVFDLTVSCPGTGQYSERFGASSVATGYASTSIGYAARCDVSSETSVAIGFDTQVNGAQVTLVGALSANYTGLATTGLGYHTSPIHGASICLGAWSASSAANQCTIGSTTYPVNALRLVADGSGGTLNLGVSSGILTVTASGGTVRIPQGHRLNLSGQYGDSLYGLSSGPLTLEPYWGVRVYGIYPAGYDADNIPAFHIDTSSANDSADIFRITNNSIIRYKFTPSGTTTITGASGATFAFNDHGTGATFAFNDPSGYNLFKVSTEYGVGSVWETSAAYVRINLRCERIAFQDNSGTTMLQASTTGLAVGNFNPVNKLGVSGSASIGASYCGIAAPTNGLIVEGNVGIGTTNPATTLEIYGNPVSDKGQLYVNNSGHSYAYVNAPLAYQAGIGFGSAGLTSWLIYRPANSADLHFYDGVDRIKFKSGGRVEISGDFAFNTRSIISSPGDGYLQLGDWASGTGSSFVMLAFGPSGTSHPAFKRSGTTMEVRLANDSGYAPLKASTLYATEHLTLGTDTNVHLGYGRALSWSSSGNSYNSACAITSGLGDTLSIQATELTLTSTAGPVSVGSNLYPVMDDAYYLGKNDDDSPKAWKGVILKDQTTGTYYRVQIDSGVLTLVDLTD